MQVTIPLSPKRKDFEEIYAKQKEGSLLHNRYLWPYYFLLGIVTVLTIALVFYCLKTNDNYLAFIPLSVFLIFLLLKAYPHIKPILFWRKQVRDYLDDVFKFEVYTLELTDYSLSITQDHTKSVINWTSFTSFFIEDAYIYLLNSNTANSCLFPKDSMKPEDYNLFKGVIVEKIIPKTSS